MTQIFPRATDAWVRRAAVIALAAAVFAAATLFFVARSGAHWRVGEAARQPIPFSHAIHAGQLNLDCRNCHNSVERAADAGMPTAQTCLGCHQNVWNVSPQFAPLRTALALDAPVAWASVNRLPDHVRFHHGAHTRAGVSCATCHGAVWDTAQTVRAETLSMQFCVDCHRDPDPRRRPADAVFARVWGENERRAATPAPLTGLGARTAVHGGVEVAAMTACSTCHR